MSEPLKPCPFCGAPGQVDGYHGRYDVLSYCGACRACDYSIEQIADFRLADRLHAMTEGETP